MYRKQSSLNKQRLAAVVLALAASGIAFADDSSMSRWTGDSYAYFNDLDYRAGNFNIARSPRTPEQDAMASRAAQSMAGSSVDKSDKVDGVTMARRPVRRTIISPFRNDTGE